MVSALVGDIPHILVVQKALCASEATAAESCSAGHLLAPGHHMGGVDVHTLSPAPHERFIGRIIPRYCLVFVVLLCFFGGEWKFSFSFFFLFWGGEYAFLKGTSR